MHAHVRMVLVSLKTLVKAACSLPAARATIGCSAGTWTSSTW
jgi:hypothetical protein